GGVGGGDGGRPVGEGDDGAGGGQRGDLGIIDSVLGGVGKVLQPAGLEGGGEDQLLGVVKALELDLGGIDGQRFDFISRRQLGGGLFDRIFLGVEISGRQGPGGDGEGRQRHEGPASESHGRSPPKSGRKQAGRQKAV